MKKIIVTTLVLVVAITLAVNAQKVQVNQNKNVDLSTYKTYKWVGGVPARNPLVNEQIITTIERTLAAKGLTKVDSDADLHVLFWAASEMDLHVSHKDWGQAPWTTGMKISQSWPVTRGTLQVNILEGKSRTIVWEGTATDTLNHSASGDMFRDAKNVQKMVNRSLEKMFKKFARKG
ncbi:MAG TPA: DUF4136 domain-containing protein [Pyrinomonadaceae bacterium]|nr:DUF4136 domain-containing protein [Pyrinomonadaceae bacterium]